jgi:hypothetical protein
MNRAGAELMEYPRKPKRETRNARPLQRGILRVSEAFPAIRVKRRASLVEVEAPAFHFHQVFDDVRAGDSLGLHDLCNAREQLGIGEESE